MQVVVEAVSSLERKMTVLMPSEQVDQEVNARLQKRCHTAKLKGFRPGKAPLSIVKQQFGDEITHEALDVLLRRSLQDALAQESLAPAGTPQVHIENYQPGQPLQYHASFEIYPEIALQPFNDLIIEKVTSEITPEDVEKTLEGMRKQQTEWQEVTDRPAALGDRVSIAFEGSIEGKPFDGGKGDNMPLVLGSKSTIEGFEDGILNAQIAQPFVLDLTFPENYGAKELAGKPVQFSITVNKIEAPILPSLDDAFAEKFGVSGGGLSKLNEEVQQTLEQQLTQALRKKNKAEVMTKLAQAYENIVLPKVLVQKEAENLRHQLQHQFSKYGAKNAPEMPLEGFTERAKERVVLGLVINEIIEKEAIKADAEKVREIINEIAQRYDHPQQVLAWYYEDKKRLSEIEFLAMEDKVVEKILSEATIVEKTLPAAEILGFGGMV